MIIYYGFAFPVTSQTTNDGTTADLITGEPFTEEATTIDETTTDITTFIPTGEPITEVTTEEPASNGPTGEPTTSVPITDVPTEEPKTDAPTEEPATSRGQPTEKFTTALSTTPGTPPIHGPLPEPEYPELDGIYFTKTIREISKRTNWRDRYLYNNTF